MKTIQAAAFLLLVGSTGCDRIHSLLSHESHDDAGAAAASAPDAGAATPPPVADTKTDLPFLAGFEGEIALVAKGTSSPTPVPLNLIVKGDTVRFDLPAELIAAKDTHNITGGGKVYGILKTPEKKLFIVLDAKKQAAFIDLDQVGDRMKSFRPPGADNAPPPAPPTVTKTGKKETVAGYPCEDWDIVNVDKSKMTTCVSDKGGASFFHLPITGIPTEHAWALDLMDGNHFPMKGVAFGKDGAETGRVEVTKLNKRTVDQAEIEVPMNYKQISIEELLMGGGKVPGDIPRDVPPGPKHGHGHKHGKH